MSQPILIDLPDELRTERTLVRPYRAGDGQAMFEAVDESREHILPWMPWGPGHAKPDDSEVIVRKALAKWITREDLPVGIFDAADGRYLGGAGLHRIDWDVRAFEIGYWIRKSAAGRGHVTDAAYLLTKLAFSLLQANRVFIRCAVENEKSAAIPRRLGFTFEGTIRNQIKDADGNLHDMLFFSLTPEEWSKVETLRS